MGTPILRITDGTTTVDLLSVAGLKVVDWRPGRPRFKGGGVRRDSPLADGSAVVMHHYDNVTDVFTLAVSHGNQDLVIRECQEADRLLLKAVAYWESAWQNEPVYLVARGADETNTRYATIRYYSIPGDSSPLASPFYATFFRRAENEVELTLEHDPWQKEIPGEGTGTYISTQQNYAPGGGDPERIYGRERANTLDALGEPVAEHYVSSKQNIANITYIFCWTAGGGWSPNLIDSFAPTALFNAPIANGDFLYFGIRTGIMANAGPFSSLVFDLSTAAIYGGAASMVWQYPNAAAWPAAGVANLSVVDRTTSTECDEAHPFENLGVNSVHWRQPTDWDEVWVNGFFGYWVRVEAVLPTVPPDSISIPWQQNRRIYSIVWPRVDIASSDVGGDVPALLKVKLHCPSECWSIAPSGYEGYFDKLMVGLRSLNRGNQFTAYLNYSSEQNPPGIAVSAHGANTNIVGGPGPPVETSAAAEYYAEYSVAAAAGPLWELAIVIALPVVDDFSGEYHCFVRYMCSTGNDGDVKCRLGISGGGMIYPDTWLSDRQDVLALSDFALMDFGRITIPTQGSSTLRNDARQSVLDLEIENTSAGARLVKFYDLILMPVDEWFGMFETNITNNTTIGIPLTSMDSLDIDSVTVPRVPVFAPLRTMALDQYMHLVSYSAGNAILQANADQRLWFLFMHATGPDWQTLPRTAPQWTSGTVQVWRAQRYISMRGNR